MNEQDNEYFTMSVLSLFEMLNHEILLLNNSAYISREKRLSLLNVIFTCKNINNDSVSLNFNIGPTSEWFLLMLQFYSMIPSDLINSSSFLGLYRPFTKEQSLSLVFNDI